MVKLAWTSAAALVTAASVATAVDLTPDANAESSWRRYPNEIVHPEGHRVLEKVRVVNS